MIGTQLRRVAVATAAVALALPLVAGIALGSPRDISVGSATVDGELTASQVSAGESTTFVVTVTNNTKQKYQHTTLYIGRDAGAATDLPEGYPTGITATAPGCTPTDGILVCSIGTLGKAPFTTTVTLASATTVAGQTITSKALVRVNEGTDAGPNNQAFAATGNLNLLGFNCDSVTAYRANGASKLVSTPCAVGLSNKQQSAIVLPSTLTSVTIEEGGPNAVACPPVNGLTCIGDAVFANITGDTTGNVIEWTIKYDITGVNFNANKLVVYHYDDQTGTLSPVGGIALKGNACKPSNPVNCGTFNLVGNELTIIFKTNGNGKTRLLG